VSDDGFADQDLMSWMANAPLTAMAEIDRELVERGGLRSFIELGWGTVEGESTYRPNWHIDAICEHFEAVSRGEIRRLMVLIPPRHMKSLSAAVFWPAYDWIANPQRRWVFASYAFDLSRRDSVKCRRVIQSQWYRDRWGDRFKLAHDQNRQDRFDNDKGGYRLSISVDGKVTGEGGNIIVIDDALNAKDANSEAARMNVQRWWDESMPTRLNDPITGAFVIVQQRLHANDLVGHIRKKNDPRWVSLCLPAEYEPDHPQRWFRDPRKEAGELLWPSRVPRQEIDELKASLGEYASAGQLQQRPVPREGGLFKRHWFHVEAFAPPDCTWSSAWDFAATAAKVTKPDPDWTSNALVGKSRTTNKFYVKRIRRFREDPGEVRRRVLATAQEDGRQVKVTIPQDPGQAGKDQAIQYVGLLAGFEVLAEAQTGDKMSRAMGFAAQASVGNVILIDDAHLPPEQKWHADFLAEITSFPTGAHDDQVDSVASAYNRLTDSTSGIIDFYRDQVEQAAAKKPAPGAPAPPQPPVRVVEETTTDLAQALRVLQKKMQNPGT
jgi:predicted phage terminase large subunit-like protein